MLRILPDRALPSSLRRLKDRIPEDVPLQAIRSFPIFGLEYARRRARSNLQLVAQAHLWAGKGLCRRVLEHGLGEAGGVYALSSAALELLQHAREHGLRAVLEQPSAPMRIEGTLIEEERRKFPKWEYGQPEESTRQSLVDREALEWEAAQTIVVPSEFVARSIGCANGPTQKCVLVPYGFEGWRQFAPRTHRRDVLRVLAVGSVRLQKGVQYLFEAAMLLPDRFRFRAVGDVAISEAAIARIGPRICLEGVVPRLSMKSYYEWADVFVFPSICDGFGLVLIEALAAGLPVVTTSNTGVAIRDGVEGFVVPICDGPAIADRLRRLDEDRDLLRRMSAAALVRAQEFTLEKYAERLVNKLCHRGSSGLLQPIEHMGPR
jgi:glycosyltransferase involved in cell wall biosynthesis